MAASKTFVSAEDLISEIYKLPGPHLPHSYNSSQLNSAMLNLIQESLRQYHMNLTSYLAMAVKKASTASPCMLCKTKDGEEPPPNTYAA